MEKEKIKIEIKNRRTGEVLFEYEKEDNTIKETVIEALKNDANLGGAYLRGADLRGADLGGAYLGGADLGDANLGGAYLRGAYLGGAYLGGAYLGGADLGDANLGGADLGDANLGDADLRGAYLGGADLGDANLGGADLGDADLRGAKNVPFIPMACPSDGAFIGWKKVREDNMYLVKLEICDDSKRSSSTGRKCRCDKAKVLQIIDMRDMTSEVSEVMNRMYKETLYKVGEIVHADSFDEDRWNECSHGIHFFINRQDAIDYDV